MIGFSRSLLLIAFLFMAFCKQATEGDPEPPDITTGLVAHWSFDTDAGGIVNDITGNQINGTAYLVTYESGKSGMAAKFNDPESKIVIPSAGFTPPESVSALATGSISVWFKYQSLGAQILPILYFGESETGTPHNSLIIEIGHGGGTNITNKRLYFTIVNQGFCFDSGFNIPENTWTHFVAVVGKEGNTGFLNGLEMTSRNYNLGSNAGYTDFFNDVPVRGLLSIGYGRYGQEDPFYSFNGSIDEVRIYNRPLSAADAKLLYQTGK
ncbi:MAG: LamG domain-containing protein [Bacteroidales bacterium]|nr:LamG domain-containing protein [Bacteroidales bacterium]